MGRLKYLEKDVEIMELEKETKLERIENELLIKNCIGQLNKHVNDRVKNLLDKVSKKHKEAYTK